MEKLVLWRRLRLIFMVLGITVLIALFAILELASYRRVYREIMELATTTQNREVNSLRVLLEQAYLDILSTVNSQVQLRDGTHGGRRTAGAEQSIVIGDPHSLESFSYPLISPGSSLDAVLLTDTTGQVLDVEVYGAGEAERFQKLVLPRQTLTDGASAIFFSPSWPGKQWLIVSARPLGTELQVVFLYDIGEFLYQQIVLFANNQSVGITIRLPEGGELCRFSEGTADTSGDNVIRTTASLYIGGKTLLMEMSRAAAYVDAPFIVLRKRYLALLVLFAGIIVLIVGLLAHIRLARERHLRKFFEEEVARQTADLSVAVKTRDRFLSLISHDLRGPLGSISQMLDFVDENREQFDEQNLFEIVQDLRVSASSVWQLAENLLLWTRAKQDRLTVHPESFAVVEVVPMILKTYHRMASEKKVDLIWDGATDVQVFADREMVATILRNLVNNAIKFTRRGDEIRIAAEGSGVNGAVMVVKDTGTGMDAATVNRLLGGTGSASVTGTSGEQGTGLGFELIRELVERNDGTLKIESAPREGTTIRVTLPAPPETISDV